MTRQRRFLPPPLKLAPARPDGRPLYFDIGFHKAMCVSCVGMGLQIEYERGQVYMNDPANSPVMERGQPDGGCYYLCRHHTPDDAVIYDPVTGNCHNKSGTEVWREDTSMPGPNGT